MRVRENLRKRDFYLTAPRPLAALLPALSCISARPGARSHLQRLVSFPCLSGQNKGKRRQGIATGGSLLF